MGRVVANFFMSLDGVVESPDRFIFPYFSEQVGAAVDAGMSGAAAFLLGRRQYDEWAAYWPTSTDEPFASRINATDKYVVSNTLTDPQWAHTSVLPGSDKESAVRHLKDRVPGDIATSGSISTVTWLATSGLLDELHLVVAPVAVGVGRRLFEGRRVPLTLASSEALDTGVLHLVYVPA